MKRTCLIMIVLIMGFAMFSCSSDNTVELLIKDYESGFLETKEGNYSSEEFASTQELINTSQMNMVYGEEYYVVYRFKAIVSGEMKPNEENEQYYAMTFVIQNGDYSVVPGSIEDIEGTRPTYGDGSIDSHPVTFELTKTDVEFSYFIAFRFRCTKLGNADITVTLNPTENVEINEGTINSFLKPERINVDKGDLAAPVISFNQSKLQLEWDNIEHATAYKIYIDGVPLENPVEATDQSYQTFDLSSILASSPLAVNVQVKAVSETGNYNESELSNLISCEE